MKLRFAALSLAASLAAAENVQQLVNSVPPCAVPCVKDAARQIGCAPDDYKCMCKKPEELAGSAAMCVLSECRDEDYGGMSTTTNLQCDHR